MIGRTTSQETISIRPPQICREPTCYPGEPGALHLWEQADRPLAPDGGSRARRTVFAVKRGPFASGVPLADPGFRLATSAILGTGAWGAPECRSSAGSYMT